MTAEVVNLRKARKAKARGVKERQAAQSRAIHGRGKAEREREAIEKARLRRELDGARLGGPGSGSGNDER